MKGHEHRPMPDSFINDASNVRKRVEWNFRLIYLENWFSYKPGCIAKTICHWEKESTDVNWFTHLSSDLEMSSTSLSLRDINRSHGYFEQIQIFFLLLFSSVWYLTMQRGSPRPGKNSSAHTRETPKMRSNWEKVDMRRFISEIILAWTVAIAIEVVDAIRIPD